MKFNIIYVDPAWTYDDKAQAGNRGASCKYELMTEQDMALLPVEDIAADNCVLFMWATYPKLREALDLGALWGFTYKTVAFTWVKQNQAWAALMGWLDAHLFQRSHGAPGPDGADRIGICKMIARLTPQRWFMGMGRWSRSNAEICLLFVKGNPQRYSADVNQIIDSPRLQHSAKPAEVRDRIERLCGKVPRVELFARTKAPGWVALGYDVDGKDLRQSIPELVKRPHTKSAA